MACRPQTLFKYTDTNHVCTDLCLAIPLVSWIPFDIVANHAHALLITPVTIHPTAHQTFTLSLPGTNAYTGTHRGDLLSFRTGYYRCIAQQHQRENNCGYFYKASARNCVIIFAWKSTWELTSDSSYQYYQELRMITAIYVMIILY